MAKGGKFTKLIKKLSFGKTSKTNNTLSSKSLNSSFSSSSSDTTTSTTLHPVYVGKSRRRYLLTTDVVSNPLLQQLTVGGDGEAEMTVGCEVVLFEHLLWMLENARPQSESLDELAEFYAC
ncbi:hypothetical protein RND81_06G177100 [Saponaria officinalis]|uniref:Uncharacterized protein n=1 Tax=Saponaria officinalis TaxID=3572 RepID=A0AAW1K7L3_SAPOF